MSWLSGFPAFRLSGFPVYLWLLIISISGCVVHKPVPNNTVVSRYETVLLEIENFLSRFENTDTSFWRNQATAYAADVSKREAQGLSKDQTTILIEQGHKIITSMDQSRTMLEEMRSKMHYQVFAELEAAAPHYFQRIQQAKARFDLLFYQQSTDMTQASTVLARTMEHLQALIMQPPSPPDDFVLNISPEMVCGTVPFGEQKNRAALYAWLTDYLLSQNLPFQFATNPPINMGSGKIVQVEANYPWKVWIDPQQSFPVSFLLLAQNAIEANHYLEYWVGMRCQLTGKLTFVERNTTTGCTIVIENNDEKINELCQ